MLENRDELRDYLSAKKVGTEIYYPLPLHLQECFKDLGYRVGDLPVSERCARQVLSLPIYPQLSEPEREYVADTVLEFINK
jgi:dTDP-4-amino-4,6-dideoxygalactose transaminase